MKHFALAREFTHNRTLPSNVPAEQAQAVQRAVLLNQELKKIERRYQQQVLSSNPRGTQKDLKATRNSLAEQLAREVLIPWLLEEDPHLDAVFKHHTGDSFLQVLPSLPLMAGDNGGWGSVSAKHGNLYIELTGHAGNHPTLEECQMEFTLVDGPNLSYRTFTVHFEVKEDHGVHLQDLLALPAFTR